MCTFLSSTRANVGITEFKKIYWLPADYRFRQCLDANAFKFFDDRCPLYMKDVLDKSCISQTSTRNPTVKLSQPLKRTSFSLFLGFISWLYPGTTFRMN